MTPMLERELEISGLRKAAAAAADGRGQVVHIAGEAGIGKSRLLTEFIEQLPKGTVSALGSCQIFDAPRPLGPLYDMSLSLGSAFRDLIKAAADDGDPYSSLAKEIAAIGPGVVLVFEDVQHADIVSLDVIDFLCQRVGALKALIIISYRDDEISPNHPLNLLLGRCPSRFTSRFSLKPISEVATISLAQSLNVSFEGVFAVAKGNPFLTLKLLRDAPGQIGCLPQAIIQWAVARLALLDPEQKNWVKLLAHCPGPVDRELQKRLVDAFGLRLDILPGWNGFLVARPDGAIYFRREIVRQALVAGLSDADRELSQRQLLTVMCADEAFAQEHSEMVVCLARASGAVDHVIRYTRFAVGQAEARGAYGDAVQHLYLALPFAERTGPDVYAEMVELWACRTSVSGTITKEMLADIEQANIHWRRHDKPVPLARNHLLLCRLYRYMANREVAKQHLHIALDLLKEADEPQGDLALALAISAQMYLEERRNDEAFRIALKAASKARIVNDRVSRLDAFVTMAVALQRQQKQRGNSILSLCKIFADRWQLHELRARICVMMCDDALAAMNLNAAERCIAEWSAIRDETPVCWKAALDGREALVLVLRGKLEDGETLATLVLDSNQTNRSILFPATLASAISRVRREAPDTASALADAEILANAIGDPYNAALVQLSKIEHEFLAGRAAIALELCSADELIFSDGHTHAIKRFRQLWRTGLQSMVHSGRDEAPGVSGAIALAVQTDLRETAKEFAEYGYAFEVALVKMFADGPDLSLLINEAAAEFTAIGAKAGVNKARSIAEEHGIVLERGKRERGPYRAARSHPLGLTRREVEILRMMVDGLSNREIAEHFGRSLRTVEHHVSAILGKMSFDNRIQAVLHAIANPTILEPAEEPV